MKKIISIISAVILMLSLAVCASAQAEPKLSVISAEAEKSGKVSINIELSDAPPIAAYSVKLNFDKTKLVPVSVSGDGIVSNLDQPGADKTSFDFVGVSWANETGVDKNGILFTVEFELKADFAGETDLTISYAEGDICTQSLDDVNPKTVSGIVVVKGDAEIKTKRSADSIDIELNKSAEGIIMAAQYDESDRLISIESKKTDSVNRKYSLKITNKEYSKIKVLLWDNNMFRYLANAVTVD